jgi:predicted amidohydrolase YtcJ
VDTVLAGFEAAADVLGATAIRAARHRLEHLEAIDDAGVATVARLGLIASVQPAFDAAWGGTEGMYAVRLGAARAAGLNPFAAMAAAAIPLAFGSDSPVTPFAPWEGIRAALRHRTAGHRIQIGPALVAHTAAGRAAGRAGSGGPGLEIAAPATFTCWRSAELDAGQDAGEALKTLGAELLDAGPVPICTLTLINGRVAHSMPS